MQLKTGKIAQPQQRWEPRSTARATEPLSVNLGVVQFIRNNEIFPPEGCDVKMNGVRMALHTKTGGGRGIGMVKGRKRDRESELVLTCRSVRSRLAAISILLGRHKYLLKWNSFSSSSSCVFVYAVRRRRGRPFSGTNSAAIENCISCLSLAVNVNLDVAPPPPHTRLDASSAVDKLHSLGFQLQVVQQGGRA